MTEDYRSRRDCQDKMVARTKLGSIIWPKDLEEARPQLVELAGRTVIRIMRGGR